VSERIVIVDGFTAGQGHPDAWRALEPLGTVVVHPRTRPSELLERCRDATAVITNKVVLDAATLRALPALRYIGVCATGTNVVDLPAARSRGIAVTNVPGYAAEAVAQLVFAALLQLQMDLPGYDAAVKAGQWAASPDFSFLRGPLPGLAGKTMVILGLGAIGGAVGRIAAAFGMKVLPAAVPGGTTTGRVPLPQALAAADVLSLHCPLTPATAGMVNAEFLRKLRPGAILINTSRGGLIDESDLAAALSSGHLGGAALDVLTQEPPPPDHALTRPDAPWSSRVLVTPHIAWATEEARLRLRTEVAENLRAFQSARRRNRVD
jgi:glycerate dehydrogenase